MDDDLIKTNIIYKSKKNILVIRKNDLEDELKKKFNNHEDKTNELSEINNEIERLNGLLEKYLNNDDDGNGTDTPKNNVINIEEIKKKCDECFDEFLNETVNLNNLEFQIKYGKIVINRTIADTTMTFKILKDSVKSQFDRDAHEFYFMDENQQIFLNEMNVKKALFPLNKVTVKNIVPQIQLIDILRKDIIDPDDIDMNRKDTENELFKNKQHINLNFKQRVLKNLLSYKFVYLNIFFYTLFILFWCISCVNFRSLDSYFLISKSFSKTLFTPIISDVIYLFFLYFSKQMFL